MNTIIYISRHSKPLKIKINYNTKQNEQIENEKIPLSTIGEEKSKQMIENKELQNIDIIYSSHYERTISTAKYIAEKNNIDLNVDTRLGERKFGVNSIEELPVGFEMKQLEDWNYKTINGESLNEVSHRMNQVLDEIIDKNIKRRIVIISHATAISVMLKRWCDIKLNKETNLVEIYFNNKLIFDGNWSAPELFKLEFDDNKNLISIENIRGDFNA